MNGDQVGTLANPLVPGLADLADNGGPTQTHALLANSPAIDTGSPSNCPSADQRGATRPADGNGDSVAVCDIGAYEALAALPSTPTPAPTATEAATPTRVPTPVCPSIPAVGCAHPARASLRIIDGPRRRLKWRWQRGTAAFADFGDPRTDATFEFCVYDDGQLALQAQLDAGSSWTAVPMRSFTYRNDGSTNGIVLVRLRAADGKAMLTVHGVGSGLPSVLPLADTMAVTAQLLAYNLGGRTCWESVFPAPPRRTGEQSFGDTVRYPVDSP